MITYEQALDLTRDEEIHYGECLKTVASRGGISIAIERWFINGGLWSPAAEEWFIPIRHRPAQFDYLSHYNANLFHRVVDCIVKEA